MKKLKRIAAWTIGIMFVIIMTVVIWVGPRLARNYVLMKMTGLDKMTEKDTDQEFKDDIYILDSYIDEAYD